MPKNVDPEKQFPVGSMVRLLSGGPTMTVKEHKGYRREIECQWFSGKKLEHGLFAPETLVAVRDGAEETQSSR